MPLLTPSLPLSKALAENSDAASWDSLDMVPMEPMGDGVFNGRGDGSECVNRLILFPYSVGVNAAFSFRVYGWRSIGNAANELVWFPSFLAEFACVSCAQQGPTDPNPRLILATENLCDTIALTSGSVGVDGSINASGGDMIGYALLDLAGCRKFQFDFMRTDPTSMNLLWAFC